MPVQISPVIIFYFISGIIALFTSARTWMMRPARGATYWTLATSFITIFVFASALEVLFTNPTWKFNMIPLIYFGVTGFSVFWILFCIEYSHHDQWINPITVIIISIIPVITFVMTLFLDQHQLIYRDYEFVEQNGLILGSVVAYGDLFYVWAAYSYTIAVFGALLVLYTAWRYPRLFRGQAIAIVISVLIPIIVSLPYTFGFNPIDPLDPSPFSMTITGMVIYYAISRYRFLKTSSVAYDVVFDHVASAVLIVDLDDQIINMNNAAEKIFHHSRDQVTGKTIADALPQLYSVTKQVQDTSQVTIDVLIDNTHFEMTMTPLHNRHGKLDGRMIMLSDMSYRMEMEKQAIQLAVERDRVQFLRQFINDASHDLKTPLTIMKNQHYLLRRELGETASRRVTTLESQSDRLIKLVDDMLLMVRLDEGDEVTLYETNLNKLIQTVIDTHPVPDGYHIQFEAASDLPHIYISPIEISQALAHLLKNALTHTAPDGNIVVCTQLEKGNVKISVRDTGTGIPEQDLPHIFERFYRVDKARGTHTGTSGLGLAIVKRIIERHGGSIDVSSTLGTGTEFCIRMPVHRQTPLSTKPTD